MMNDVLNFFQLEFIMLLLPVNDVTFILLEGFLRNLGLVLQFGLSTKICLSAPIKT